MLRNRELYPSPLSSPRMTAPILIDSDLATVTTFQERMFERVRESLRELLTAEEAKALVDKAIQESLFKAEPIYDNYRRVTGSKPSAFVELVRNEIQPLVKTCIQEWLAEHEEEVKTSIQTVVEQGIAGAVIKVFRDEMRHPMYELGGKLQQVINKIGGIQ